MPTEWFPRYRIGAMPPVQLPNKKRVFVCFLRGNTQYLLVAISSRTDLQAQAAYLKSSSILDLELLSTVSENSSPDTRQRPTLSSCWPSAVSAPLTAVCTLPRWRWRRRERGARGQQGEVGGTLGGCIQTSEWESALHADMQYSMLGQAFMRPITPIYKETVNTLQQQ